MLKRLLTALATAVLLTLTVSVGTAVAAPVAATASPGFGSPCNNPAGCELLGCEHEAVTQFGYSGPEHTRAVRICVAHYDAQAAAAQHTKWFNLTSRQANCLRNAGETVFGGLLAGVAAVYGQEDFDVKFVSTAKAVLVGGALTCVWAMVNGRK